MKVKFLVLILGVTLVLSSHNAGARDQAQPKTETEQLRDRVTHLEEHLKQLEALLTAKEILPPSRFERPELWTQLKIKMDAAGVIRLSETVLDTSGLKNAIQKVFKDGKFPDVVLSATRNAPLDKIQALLKDLGTAGVPNVSFETSSN